MKKLKRQSVKANVIRDKLGLGYKPAHTRSKSGPPAGVVSPTRKDAHGPLSTHQEDPSSNGHSRAASMDYRTPKFFLPKVQIDPSPLSMKEEDPFQKTTPKTSHVSFPAAGRLATKISSSSSDEEDPELSFLHRAGRR